MKTTTENRLNLTSPNKRKARVRVCQDTNTTPPFSPPPPPLPPTPITRCFCSAQPLFRTTPPIAPPPPLCLNNNQHTASTNIIIVNISLHYPASGRGFGYIIIIMVISPHHASRDGDFRNIIIIISTPRAASGGSPSQKTKRLTV